MVALTFQKSKIYCNFGINLTFLTKFSKFLNIIFKRISAHLIIPESDLNPLNSQIDLKLALGKLPAQLSAQNPKFSAK